MMIVFRIIVFPIYITLLILTLAVAIPFVFIDRDVYNGRFGRSFLQGVREGDNNENS